MGVRLFDRDKRGTTLTPAGRILIVGASNIENILARTQEAIQADAMNIAGPLAVGGTPSMMLGLIPKALAVLARHRPKLSLNVREGLDNALLPDLRRGEIELLVGPLEPYAGADPDIVEIPLLRERFFIGMPRDHGQAGRAELNVKDLVDEAWSLPAPGSGFFRVVEALFLSAGVGLPRNAVATNSLPLQELMVATGRLCMVTPSQLAGREVPFTIVPIAQAPVRVVGIRHLASLHLSPIASTFIETLGEAAAQLVSEQDFIAPIDGPETR